MSLKTMTRRSFVQLAAVTGAAMGLSGAVAGTALAEGDGAAAAAAGAGEVKRVRSCCRACGKNECGVYVYVHNGRAVKVVGDMDTAFHYMVISCS